MRYSYEKIARRNFLKLVGVSASIPILQSLPIASASATDLSDYPLLKDGIFDFENTDITQYVDDVQEVFGSEKDMIEEMLSSGELTPQDLKQHLLELAEQPSSVLVERGFSESQIAIIEEYDGIEDAFDYLYAPNERTGIARSSATVKFLYGLAGSGSRQKVTIAYDIKWSERPIYVGIDSFGIGWIAADSSSHQLATKTASAVGEVSYCYASTGNSAGLSSSVDMDTSQSGGVVGTPVIINHQNTSTYGKHISGTVGVGTQSNSSNMETIQIFVAYAHSTVSVTFSADVALQWKQVGMSINFTPQKRQQLLQEAMQRLNITAKGIRPLERFDLYHRKESHALRFSCFNGNFGRNVPRFLVKAIKSTDKNEADGALFGARVILGMLMLIVGMFLDAW